MSHHPGSGFESEPPHSNHIYSSGDVPIIRWLVLQGICRHRKHAAELIANTSVQINGQICHHLYEPIRPQDSVHVNMQLVQHINFQHSHYILYKPPGCLSVRRNLLHTKSGDFVPDPRPSIFDFITDENDRMLIKAIGRLDIDTTGIILFTSDGVLNNALASPLYKVEKVYRCTLRTREPLSEEHIMKLKNGVKLRHAKGAVVTGRAWNVNEQGIVDLCITGGYNHQVKHMMGIIGRPLQLLHRLSFAGLELPPDLEMGRCRKLTSQEIHHLYTISQQGMEKIKDSLS